MNSTAVIIGAMLISPLMGPINAMGYSIATYNLDLFRQSLKNFSFAVLASLVASTTYFAISPVSTAHSEILARTAPTIYDVLIAMFGGLAGIVAISSKKKGNVIPGVAIATALMPPLCTAGYGLATGQFNFFFGAFYLFTINSVFMALASVAISQILKFPIRTLVDPSQKKKINRLISLVIMVVLFPSIYFGYNLVQNEKFTENANRYILNVSAFEGNYLLKSEINATRKTITLVYGGISLSENQKERIGQKAAIFHLSDAQIEISQGLTFAKIDEKNAELFMLKQELSDLNVALNDREKQIDSLTKKAFLGNIIFNEIRNFYPQITGCIYAETFEFRKNPDVPVKTVLILFTLEKKKISNSEKKKIKEWLQARLNIELIKIIYE
jgi:uncharacterized hydrophobic protein (TIGR00271 family)